MSEMQRQYSDSSKLMARAALHMKYGPPGKAFSIADTGLIGAGAKVLDIGCGPARFWAMNAARLPSDLDLTLADQSPGMVAEALRNVAVPGWRVGGQQADVCALPFDAASFDVVTAMHMLYHAADVDRAAAEIARVLKPDGILIATTNGAGTMAELNALSADTLGARFPSVSFTLESGEPLLQRYFATVTVHAQTDVLCVTDGADVVNYLRSFPPGDESAEATIVKLREELATRMAAQNNTFPITRTAGYIVAKN